MKKILNNATYKKCTECRKYVFICNMIIVEEDRKNYYTCSKECANERFNRTCS